MMSSRLSPSESRSRSSAPANTVQVELMRTALVGLHGHAGPARAGPCSSRRRCSPGSARSPRRSGRSSGSSRRCRSGRPGSPWCPGRRCRARCAVPGYITCAPRPWHRISRADVLLRERQPRAAVAGAHHVGLLHLGVQDALDRRLDLRRAARRSRAAPMKRALERGEQVASDRVAVDAGSRPR